MSSAQSVAVPLDRLVDANARAAEEFCRLLRDVDDTSQLTLGGKWTVRDTAVHLMGYLKFYTAFLDGQPSPVVRIEDIDLLNAAFFMVLDETDSKVLADRVAESVERFNRRAATLNGEDMR